MLATTKSQLALPSLRETPKAKLNSSKKSKISKKDNAEIEILSFSEQPSPIEPESSPKESPFTLERLPLFPAGKAPKSSYPSNKKGKTSPLSERTPSNAAQINSAASLGIVPRPRRGNGMSAALQQAMTHVKDFMVRLFYWFFENIFADVIARN